MKNLITVFFAFCCLFAGCASYSAVNYRRNVENSAARKMGHEISPDARQAERNSLRRESSVKKTHSSPVYGDTIGKLVYYKVYIINESYNTPTTWRLYDQDGVVMGAGRLESVMEKRRRLYSQPGLSREERGVVASENFSIDSISVPYGVYTIKWNWNGAIYPYSRKISSSPENVYGRGCHGHFYIKD